MEISIEKARVLFEKFYSKTDNILGTLMCRWYDEYGYEDIAEYKKCLQNSCGKSISIDGLKGYKTRWIILLNKSVYVFCDLKGDNLSLGWSRKNYYDKLKGSSINFD